MYERILIATDGSELATRGLAHGLALAAALHAPVLLCFGLYRGGNRYDLHFEPFADLATAPPPRAARAQWLQQQVHAYAARLEHHARRMPFNWFNFYDFWSGHER